MALSELGESVASGGRAALRLDPLAAADVEAGLALSDAAGWNQTGDDWALFIEKGHAIGYRDGANRLVATAAALPYGDRAGWISMVLVAEAWRHRGLARALLDACVEHLRSANIVPLLDATPAGAEVYRRHGFVAGFEIDRWQWQASLQAAPEPQASATASPRPASIADLDAIAALDRAATGLDRRFLLASFLSRPQTKGWCSADGRGFVIARAGHRATQIGPLIASRPHQALALLATAFASARLTPGRSVFLDLPRCRVETAAWLAAQGFARQRPFVRMALGAAHPPALGEACHVLAGPEFG